MITFNLVKTRLTIVSLKNGEYSTVTCSAVDAYEHINKFTVFIFEAQS